MPTKRNELVANNAYDIGREEFINQHAIDRHKFYLKDEQLAYEAGYEVEREDQEFVLPYYIRLGGRSNGRR